MGLRQVCPQEAARRLAATDAHGCSLPPARLQPGWSVFYFEGKFDATPLSHAPVGSKTSSRQACRRDPMGRRDNPARVPHYAEHARARGHPPAVRAGVVTIS
jgi:hypothetical protein